MERLLFVIPKFNYAGAAKAMGIVANSLSKYFKVTVFAYLKSEAVYPMNSEVNIHCGGIVRPGVISKCISPISSIREEINNVEPDVVIAFLDNASFYTIMASRGKTCKTIVCERCDPFNENSFRFRLFRSIFTLADGAVFQTEGAQKYYSKLLDKSVVIPNMVDASLKDIHVDCFNKRANEINVFSRLEIKQKRLDILLKAFKIVNESFPEIILKIYGDGPDLDYLMLLRHNLNLDDKIVFCGSTENAIELLARAKLTVLTSDYEGVPNAVLDALAIGIPCVATDASPGGVRTLIDNGKNGFIVPCGDYESVANAIISILNNPELADTFSEKSREVNDKFSSERLSINWKNFIDKTLGTEE